MPISLILTKKELKKGVHLIVYRGKRLIRIKDNINIYRANKEETKIECLHKEINRGEVYGTSKKRV